MKKTSLAITLLLFSTIAFGSIDFECYMPSPTIEVERSSDSGNIDNTKDGLMIDYLVYNGTEDSAVQIETLNTYRNLVKNYSAFFEVRRPSIALFDNLNDAAAFAGDSLESKQWRVFIVIGDKKDAQWLHENGLPAIAFVPSEDAIEPTALRLVETATKRNYYAVAIDHAFRRGTRMAAEIEPNGLSTVTVEHIVSDARKVND